MSDCHFGVSPVNYPDSACAPPLPAGPPGLASVLYDSDYPHDDRDNKNPYPHDRRADKDSYPHDSNN